MRFGRRSTSSGFSLIEILIALFVFMIGILGVLAVFPVAINSAGQAIGEVRSNMLTASALAQLMADCRGRCYEGEVKGTTLTDTTVQDATTPNWTVNQWAGYFVTVTEGDSPARWQCRLIRSNAVDTLTISPPWNPWPLDADAFVITRMGLPSLPRGAVVAPLPTGVSDRSLHVSVDIVDNDPPLDDEWNGYYVQILNGSARGTIRRIIATDASDNAFTLDRDWRDVPAAGDRFCILRTRPRVLFSGAASAPPTSPATLTMAGAGWAANEWDGYYVRIVGSEKAEGEVRRITATDLGAQRLDLHPDWDWAATPPETPEVGDTFEIVEAAGHVGVVHELKTADTFRAGMSSDNDDVIPLTWHADGFWAQPTYESGPYTAAGGDSTSVGGNSIEGGGPWADGEHVGKLVVIETDGNTDLAFKIDGQVRLITRNINSNELYVWPDWSVPSGWTDASDWGNVAFRIRSHLGHFLLFTDGRARGRVFAMTGFTNASVNIDETEYTYQPAYDVTSYDVGEFTLDTRMAIGGDTANLKEFRVTEAKRKVVDGPPAEYDFKLRNATRFIIAGNRSWLTSAHLRMDSEFNPKTEYDTSVTPNIPFEDRRWSLNTFGIPKSYLPQVGGDVTLEGRADGKAVERNTSEYSVVCIFGDNGPFPDGPVRVDVLVFRNFDSTQTLAANRKAVGFMSGYVGRP